MRPLDKMIKAIKAILPEEFEGKADLLYDLESIESSLDFSQPRNIGDNWGRLLASLEELGPPDTDWKVKLQDLMSSKLDYRTVLGE